VTAIQAEPQLEPRSATVDDAQPASHVVLDHLAVLLVLGVWAVPLTRASGGRGVHHELVFAGVALMALLLLRPWRFSRASSVLAALVAAAALAVCALTPTGWSGSDVAASYAVSAATFVIIRTYAITAQRRLLVLAAVALASLVQFSEAFLPWWGGRDPAIAMTGTFYWHNPYAAFLIPGAVLGLGLAHANEKPWRFVGWFGAPLCVAGVVFSSSRAALGVLALAWVVTAAIVVRTRRGALRVAAVTLLATVVVLVLPGPPFFPHRASPFAATSARASSGETLDQSGFYRTEFWRESLDVMAHHPAAGAGYHSLSTASALYTPVGWARSQLAHNGYLQPLSDGGLLLGVPFLLAVALAGVRALRTVGRALGPLRRTRDEPQMAVAAVTFLALMAHSGVDFDWSHPSLMIAAAILAAVLFAAGKPSPDATASAVVRRAAPVAVTVLALSLVMSVVTLHAWQRSADTGGNKPVSARLAAASSAFGDFRPAKSVLLQAIATPSAVTDAQAHRAVALTAAAARVDYHLRLWRDTVMAQRGEAAVAVADARALIKGLDGPPIPYVLDYAQVLAAAGNHAEAAVVLTDELRRQVTDGPNSEGAAEVHLLATVDNAGDYACAYQQLSGLIAKGSWAAIVPAPTASCGAAG